MITLHSKELFFQRTDYPWLLLATAAGTPEAVIQVTRALTREQLDRPMRDRLFGPPQTREMVEALAAWDVTVLSQLAVDWIAPSSLNTKTGWCSLYAWMAAIRHLRCLGVVEYQKFKDSSFSELCDQADHVWNKNTIVCLSWHEINSLPWLRSKLQYDFTETVLTSKDLNDVKNNQLVVLRGRTNRLTQDAKSALVDLSISSVMALETQQKTLRSITNDHETLDVMRCCICVQLCDEMRVNIRPLLAEVLDLLLPTITKPEDISPLVYVLFGKWYWP